MDWDFGPKCWKYLKNGPKFVWVWVEGSENIKKTMICLLVDLTLTQDKSEVHFRVIDGNWLTTDGEWLDFECVYSGVLFDFLKRKYFLVFKLKDTSKKFVSMRFISIAIDSPSSLNKLTLSFLNLSNFRPLALWTMATTSVFYFFSLSLVPLTRSYWCIEIVVSVM